MNSRLSFAISNQYASTVASILIARRFEFGYSCWVRRSLGVFVLEGLERSETESLLKLLADAIPETLSHVSSTLVVDSFTEQRL